MTACAVSDLDRLEHHRNVAPVNIAPVNIAPVNIAYVGHAPLPGSGPRGAASATGDDERRRQTDAPFARTPS